MKYLLEIDRTLFFYINITLQNPLFDWLMPFITNFKNFRIPFAIGAVLLFISGKKKERIFLILLIGTVLIADFIASQVLKNTFARIRPCNALQGAHLLVGCTGSYSFPSSHAVNITVFATLISFKYRYLMIPVIILAVFVSFSRIYVGAHYPLDVLGGALIGLLISLGAIYIDKRYLKRLYNPLSPEHLS
ncbi:MAG: phosphatase PAP2 family protein [Nitrospirae bacterium]|nr:phosphatase PAP2 family protein [Nitrospirota bacterium]